MSKDNAPEQHLGNGEEPEEAAPGTTSHVFEMEEQQEGDDDAEKETLLSLSLQPEKEERPRKTKKMNILRRHRFLQPAKGKKRNQASIWRDFVSCTMTNRCFCCCCCLVGGIMFLLVAAGILLTHLPVILPTHLPNEVDGLDTREIHQRCLEQEDTDCQCPNPLLPTPRQPSVPKWNAIHETNVQKASSAAENASVDVVFLGDSITEGWCGTSYDMPRDDKRANVPVFNSLFDKSKGGEFTGLASGIAGDTSPNLAWRIQNGEAPPNLQPRVWWVLIGTNDFQRNDPKCSEEVVLMGIQRVLLELQQRQGGARVVVNSLLPRADDNKQYRLTAKRLDDGGRTVWNAIQKVNAELERICENSPGLEFFNATHVFVRQLDSPPEKEADSRYFIPPELMADQLHPTAKGYKHWGNEIVKRLHFLLDE